MFAGPNGSGKSELKKYLPPALLGVYLNPDEIEAAVRQRGFLDFNDYGAATAAEEGLAYLRRSQFLASAGLADQVKRLGVADSRLMFTDVKVNAYLASVAADFLRRELLRQQVSFTFETVMSSPDKVAR